MKLHEEFSVADSIEQVWSFFEQPEAVAGCMPGVESVTVLDDDNVSVRATQSIGPMSATFEAKVTVLERVPNELIRFRATGRSVRGAGGNLRTENAVRLRTSPEGTVVVVDGEVVLAGALGSVGQKIVAKQAGKVTAEFAANLQRALRGEAPATRIPAPPVAGGAGGADGRATAGSAVIQPGAVRPDRADSSATAPRPDRWARVAALLSAVSLVLDVIILVRQRRPGGNGRPSGSSRGRSGRRPSRSGR
jgi:hypothetical protein